MLEIGLYGLGRMGGNMARRLARGGVKVHALNRSFEVAVKLAGEEANVVAYRVARDMVAGLAAPRVVWLMLPAGEATDSAIKELSGLLVPGDLLVDGANGFYQDAMRRAGELEDAGIRFADVGVSGGIWGLANGYCLMAGSADLDIARLVPFLSDAPLAPIEWSEVPAEVILPQWRTHQPKIAGTVVEPLLQIAPSMPLAIISLMASCIRK